MRVARTAEVASAATVLTIVEHAACFDGATGVMAVVTTAHPSAVVASTAVVAATSIALLLLFPPASLVTAAAADVEEIPEASPADPVATPEAAPVVSPDPPLTMVARSTFPVTDATLNHPRSMRSMAEIPPVPVKVCATPATEDEIPSVASSTTSFSEKMQPRSGSSASQELPFPVESLG